MFTVLKTNKYELKCKLNARALLNLEKRLGTNPLNLFMNMQGTELPKLEVMLIILHESLQSLQHGIEYEEVYDIYDDYIESGNTFADFVKFIVDIYKVSGFFKEEKKGRATKEKN